MKKIIILLIILIINLPLISQNIGIGTSTPDNSSILDIQSSNKGILIPRMSETERLNIISAGKGLSVYQTDNKEGIYYFDGLKWLYTGNYENNPWLKNTDIYSAFSGDKVGIGTNTPNADIDIIGYLSALNNFTVIPLWKGLTYTINNNSPADVPDCESGIIPELFGLNGNIQVKMIIRATARSGINHFQLRAHNGISEIYPIITGDSWTWAYTGGGETVTSPWKDWNAGTTPFEIHLNAWSENSGDYVTINAVYIVIREKQP